MRISVLVVTKDRQDKLTICLKGIFESDSKPYEIIVIDGSPNKVCITDQRINGRTQKISYHHIPGIGLSEARNYAVKISNGDCLVFIDDDCIIHPTALLKIKKHFLRGKIDGLFGKITNGSPLNIYSYIQQIYYDRWVFSLTGKTTGMIKIHGPLIPGMDLAAFRKDALNATPFAERLPYGIDEDIVFGNQFRGNKFVSYFDPNIQAVHIGRESAVELFKRNFLIGYANEYIKETYNIDVRHVTYKSNRIPLEAVYKATCISKIWIPSLVIMFWIYPLFSRLGRFSYKLRSFVSLV